MGWECIFGGAEKSALGICCDYEGQWRGLIRRRGSLLLIDADIYDFTGWAKFMEWKYPVEIVISNPASFKGAGAIEAAATL